MMYEEFRGAFLDAMRASGLPTLGLQPDETIDLRNLDREFVVYIEADDRRAEPFHVGLKISFCWDALKTARGSTNEENVLVELLGREEAAEVETEQPWVRVDITLTAGMVWGHSVPVPNAAAMAQWLKEIRDRLEGAESLVAQGEAPDYVDVPCWQGDPELRVRCRLDGELRLEAVELHAFQGVYLPREWDSSERGPDESPQQPLASMCERLRVALGAWSEMIGRLSPTRSAHN